MHLTRVPLVYGLYVNIVFRRNNHHVLEIRGKNAYKYEICDLGLTIEWAVCFWLSYTQLVGFIGDRF